MSKRHGATAESNGSRLEFGSRMCLLGDGDCLDFLAAFRNLPLTLPPSVSAVKRSLQALGPRSLMGATCASVNLSQKLRRRKWTFPHVTARPSQGLATLLLLLLLPKSSQGKIAAG
ncbi:hypothetical protein GGTG_03159 [Gaeumannomyces tritici R3-111a-1]|uniref:Uncharacterized protein n=1 Tax=Gaeumannomyces tritici (strain R3-111a-1) TaxID=644352 RepID=J3NPF1_GAET3|nr:hypothetical protein GGTG_03159 [Gaeumannomyces tritici R3-111a-1]EJT78056.1 hypothetical protein GGTG_03159 [Gaeumannomyces tritici R3-111a-1]